MRARVRNAPAAPLPAHALVRRKRTAHPAPQSWPRRGVSGARRWRCPPEGLDLSLQIPPARETRAAVADLGGVHEKHTAGAAKCAGRCAEMRAGARRVLAQLRTTAHSAWGCPAHRRLKVQPLLLLDDPQQRPTRNQQAALVSAAAAQAREADVLRAQSTRRSTISTILLTAGSGAPSRLGAAPSS